MGVLYALEPLFTVIFVINMNIVWEKVMSTLRAQIFGKILIQKVKSNLYKLSCSFLLVSYLLQCLGCLNYWIEIFYFGRLIICSSFDLCRLSFLTNTRCVYGIIETIRAFISLYVLYSILMEYVQNLLQFLWFIFVGRGNHWFVNIGFGFS